MAIFYHKQNKRSPLKQKPLRNPGESLDRQIEQIYDEDMASHVYMILFVIVLVGLEWFRWFTNEPPKPAFATFVGIPVIAYCVYAIVRTKRRVRPLELGLQGEKIVGQELEHLRSHGCEIIHDIPCDGFNIDHVIVSTHGIFVVETKTISKPVRGSPPVKFDGERVLVNGFSLDRDPIKQVVANRDWVVKFLQETTSYRYPAKGVVVFPGWWVEQTKPSAKSDLFVLNPGQLGPVILHEPEALKKEDVALICSRLALHVRDHA